MATKFEFDGTKTPDENIESFFKELDGINPGFAKTLRENIKEVLPLPENTTQRSAKRKQFNKVVAQALEAANSETESDG